MAGKDLRNFAERTSALRYPYWLDSKLITFKDAGNEIVIADFPAAYGMKQVLLLEAYVEIVDGFAGTGLNVNVGSGSIVSSKDFMDGDTVTVVDADAYIDQTDITPGTAGLYWAASGPLITAKAAGHGAGRLINCADNPVPVIYATIAGTNLTAGSMFVHFLATVCPNRLS